MQRPKLYLIDGSGYIFRAYYAIRPLSTRAGVPTNAVLGFAKMLGKLLKEDKPSLLGIAFDTREPTFRHAAFAAYKANRDSPPEDLVPQFSLIHELVEAMDIPILRAPGFEADDVLATLAVRATSQGFDVVIVSGDKDIMQLVGEHITLYDPMKDKRYDDAAVIEKFGVPPALVADVQALAGDTSDNIPGVPKVGLKSAAKLVESFGDIEAVIQGLQQQGQRKAFEQSVIDHQDKARLSKKLTVLKTDAPVELDTQALAYSHPRQEKLAPFLQKIEAYALLREFGFEKPHNAAAANGAAPPETEPATESQAPPAPPKMKPEPLVVHIDRAAYQTITTPAALEALTERLRGAGRLCIDLETTSLDANRASIVGFALCAKNCTAAYIPVSHRYIGAPSQLSCDVVLEALKPLLEDARVAKVGQNLKYDMVVLKRAGVAMAGIGDDSMLAAYVLDPARPSFGLDALAREALGHHTIAYAEVVGTGKNQRSFEEVPLDQATLYAAEDADVALRLCDHFAGAITDEGLQRVYRELELPLLPVLADMEFTGIEVSTDTLKALAGEFNERLEAIEKRALALVGHPINLASPKQLSELFFEKMGLPVVKKTKTGASTDQEVLEILARDHEIAGVVLEHRLLSKLKSTYVDSLPKMVNPITGRVHTSYNQTGAATGRLSSSDPNLQNIPIRGDDGRRIREAFVAKKDHVLLSADYSQVELRMLAHLCEDASFVAAFVEGEDIHNRTAREVLTGGAEPDATTRRQAKAINFGIIYGLSEFGLSKQLGISRTEARTYISNYFARYPKIRSFFDLTFKKARASGYVETIMGRRRYLPDLNSKNHNARTAAERVAMNTPIQGSAADLIKSAMLKVAERLEREGHRAKLLLQVHDELVFEVPNDELEAVSALVRHEMTSVMKLAVPLVVDLGYGKNWGVAH